MTELVGILNITPDSFSDGGKFTHLDAAIQQCQKMLDEGATIIDIGAESTRPNATPLTANEEWQRLVLFLPEIRKTFPQLTLSLDSYHIKNIEKSLEIGINWVNFISSDITPSFLHMIQHYTHVKIILMHNLGIPASKSHIMPQNSNIIDEINKWFIGKINQLKHVMESNNIILDPGIGFGKNAEQSLCIIENAEQLHLHNLPILIGHSRKSFLQLPHADNKEKDEKTAYYTSLLCNKNIHYVRVHNISINKAAIQNDTI